VRVLADLHNHSCLSPCASLEESPSLLARLARERGLDLVALTDHNSALNCPAFAEACAREGIAPLFGIEACSVEEVHVLCLFGTVDEALEATVVGSFSSIGPAVRSRTAGWTPPPSLACRTVLVTGATSGIGLAAAKGVATAMQIARRHRLRPRRSLCAGCVAGGTTRACPGNHPAAMTTDLPRLDAWSV